MASNPFVGTWVYRSFHNIPEEIDDFNDIRLWQAELTLEEDGPDLLTGRIAAGSYALDISGAVTEEGGTAGIRLRARGVDNTPTAGWGYDYAGVLAPGWPEGERQRPAIVGTVIRTTAHEPDVIRTSAYESDRLAARTYSFIAVNKAVPPPAYELPGSVVTHFADRLRRLHHTVWHGVRNNWNDLKTEEQEALADLGWSVEGGRMALYTGRERTRPCTTNGSGEDFLFCHRQLLAQYLALMAEARTEPIRWAEIPQPGSGGPASPDAVPPAFAVPMAPSYERRLAALKTDEFYWSRMRWWECRLKDPVYLATLTLGELGSLIEFGIHTDMQIRWCTTPRDPDTRTALSQSASIARPAHDTSDKWDNPEYNWLGEYYSCQVNPVFWRLHGWIDDRIEDWFAAHEMKHHGEVKRVDKGGVPWFEPGRWVQVEHPWVWPRSLGGYEPGQTHGQEDEDGRRTRIANMQEVMKIIFPPREEPLPQAALAVGSAAVGTRARETFRSSIIGV